MYEYIEIPHMEYVDVKNNYYTTLSVELGNTTTKAIIMTTNLKDNTSYMINKTVELTCNIQKIKGEASGETIWKQTLTYPMIKNTVSSIIKKSLKKANISVNDLDFVVRSTGIITSEYNIKNMGIIIKALSDGCLEAGIKPSQMRAALNKENLPSHIKSYSFINNISFDGSVVSVKETCSGIVSNQMESELVTAGLKLASKQSLVDFRNPVISIDMGTTLAGEVVDNQKPYADVKYNFIGMAGAIVDILLKNAGLVENSTMDLKNNTKTPQVKHEKIHKNTLKIHDYISICEVPHNTNRFGCVCIDKSLYNISSQKIIGCTITNKDEMITTFNKIIENYTPADISYLIDDICAYIIKRLVNIININTTLGITGRAGITGYKPKLVSEYLPEFNIIFVPDALALGALMMARCMNSLGTPLNPIGGSHKGVCIMADRIKYNK